MKLFFADIEGFGFWKRWRQRWSKMILYRSPSSFRRTTFQNKWCGELMKTEHLRLMCHALCHTCLLLCFKNVHKGGKNQKATVHFCSCTEPCERFQPFSCHLHWRRRQLPDKGHLNPDNVCVWASNSKKNDLTFYETPGWDNIHHSQKLWPYFWYLSFHEIRSSHNNDCI